MDSTEALCHSDFAGLDVNHHNDQYIDFFQYPEYQMSSILPMLSLGGRRFIQSTSLSTQWKLHLSVTSTHGNRSLPVSSSKWKKLRAEILLRDNHTCSSCGYLSPHPKGRYMIVDHADGDASNNDPSNLRVHCPPCDAIRHCGFSGIHEWLTVSESAMEQVDIVRKTREMFEKTGVIPYPESIDPSLKPVDIGVVELANIMLETPWKFLPKELQRLRGFFTKNSSYLFHKTTLADAYVCFLHFKGIISYVSSAGKSPLTI